MGFSDRILGKKNVNGGPHIESVSPALALAGGEIRIAGGKLPPITLPTNCPGCGVALEPDELRKHNYVCDCGHHFRLGADGWIALIADRGSWQERWGDGFSRRGWTRCVCSGQRLLPLCGSSESIVSTLC